MSEWFTESFGNDYLLVYKHRDMQGAKREVKRMIDWLGLPSGAEVLDLCCGMGRHSMALHEFGYNVTGVDLSEVLLAEAHKVDADGSVRWLKGDMRSVPLEQTFDAVLNLFTSFGYFEEEAENVNVLKQIERLLKPGGKFIIDFLNPVYVTRNLVPSSERNEDGIVIQEFRKIEDGYVKKRIVISEANKPNRTYSEQVKLFGLADFQRMMASTGLKVDRIHGDYEAMDYDPQSSTRLILVGHKQDGGAES